MAYSIIESYEKYVYGFGELTKQLRTLIEYETSNSELIEAESIETELLKFERLLGEWLKENRQAVRVIREIIRERRVKQLRREMTRRFQGLFILVGRRDGFACRVCRDPAPDLQIDHITPIALDGGNEIDNLQLLCAKCNQAKSDQAPALPLTARA
jgi:hypothetical protein